MKKYARVSFAVGAALGLAALTGCASPDVDDASSAALQTLVSEVGTTAAASDIAGALARLDAVQAKLDEAKASGDVTTERARTIQGFIDLVRADLQALVPTPAPAAEEPVVPADAGVGDDNTSDQTGDDTGDDTSDQTGDDTGDQTGDDTSDQTGDDTRDQTGDDGGEVVNEKNNGNGHGHEEKVKKKKEE
jgi:hypothetical protein